MLTTTSKELDLLIHPSKYQWYFEGAGIANIDKVYKNNDGSISTEYSYESGGERRKGINTLSQSNEKEIYTGNWITKSNKGNTYEGLLNVKFDEDGTAHGYWTWKGVKGKWIIKLNKINH